MIAEVVLADQTILAWLADTISLIKYMITEVVSAGHTILALLADTSFIYKIYDCRNGTGWPHNISLAGQYHFCIEYMITEVVWAD